MFSRKKKSNLRHDRTSKIGCPLSHDKDIVSRLYQRSPNRPHLDVFHPFWTTSNTVEDKFVYFIDLTEKKAFYNGNRKKNNAGIDVKIMNQLFSNIDNTKKTCFFYESFVKRLYKKKNLVQKG